MSENTETNDKTERLVSRAFRKKTRIFEKLLAMRLISATFSSDTKVIIDHVTAAASMVEQTNPSLDGLDFEKMRFLKKISDDFLKIGRYTYKIEYKYNSPDHVSHYPIPWSFNFTKQIYAKYIESWDVYAPYIKKAIKVHRKRLSKLTHQSYLSFSSKGCRKLLAIVDPDKRTEEEKKWIGKKCPHCGDIILEDDVSIETKDFIIETPKWSFFLEKSHYLTLFGVKTLHTSFRNYARDECLKALAVMSDLISENIYDQILKQLKSGDVEKPKIGDHMA